MFYNYKLIISIILLLTTLPSCTTITRSLSTPTYSIHAPSKIQLNNTNASPNIYIKPNTNDIHNVYQHATEQLIEELQRKNINIVNNINKANYILSLHIKNIAMDVNYNFAKAMRRSLASEGAGLPYTFDTNNTPHVSNHTFTPNNSSFETQRRRLTTPTVITLAGGSIGFAAGFLLASSISPLIIGTAGAVTLGTLSYLTYNTFRHVGIIVTYEVIINEQNSQAIKHSRKTLVKKSSNSSDETYYSYQDSWNELTTQETIIATGSRMLTKDMMSNICNIISRNVANIFIARSNSSMLQN